MKHISGYIHSRRTSLEGHIYVQNITRWNISVLSCSMCTWFLVIFDVKLGLQTTKCELKRSQSSWVWIGVPVCHHIVFQSAKESPKVWPTHVPEGKHGELKQEMSPNFGIKTVLSQLFIYGPLWSQLWMWGKKKRKERKLCYTSLERWAWERELIWQLSIFASNWITVCRWGTLQENVTPISQESQIWNFVGLNTRDVINRFSFFYYSEIFVVYVTMQHPDMHLMQRCIWSIGTTMASKYL